MAKTSFSKSLDSELLLRSRGIDTIIVTGHFYQRLLRDDGPGSGRTGFPCAVRGGRDGYICNWRTVGGSDPEGHVHNHLFCIRKGHQCGAIDACGFCCKSWQQPIEQQMIVVKSWEEVSLPIAVVYRPPTAEQYKLSWRASDDPPVPTPLGLLFHAEMGEGDAFFTVTV